MKLRYSVIFIKFSYKILEEVSFGVHRQIFKKKNTRGPLTEMTLITYSYFQGHPDLNLGSVFKMFRFGSNLIGMIMIYLTFVKRLIVEFLRM